ncbi:HAD-IA family hydrolase [Pseudonocardia spinosispora]|uniref:HAD-IA family hydrolase n=1 Tax=Pseudonocardia spinosispora TaxID=103441 RepID=UPI00041712C4|nr:HAD-IA family hydrolase [Pseudonocardia spinosispora]
MSGFENGSTNDDVGVERLSVVRAVLLDMDGTLVDSDAAVRRSWRIWAIENGADPTAVLGIAFGIPAAETVRRTFPEWDEERAVAQTRRQLARECADVADVVATPGAHRLLTYLTERTLPWAIVTSASAELAAARLGSARIDPPLLITVDDVTIGKPDPQGYLTAARRLNVSTRDCLVVEDSPAGVAAGRAAGALTAGLKGTDADLPLTDLNQLIDLLTAARRDQR